MPFFVPIEIKRSPLQGHGVYAAADIKKGSIVWCYQENDGMKAIPVINNTSPFIELLSNKLYVKETLEKETPEARQNILWFGFPHVPTKTFINLRDGCQFTNHTETPNCGGDWAPTPEFDTSVAIRDIKKGEEILEDYGTFADDSVDWVDEFMKKDCPGRYEYEKTHVKSHPEGFVHKA